MASHAVRTAHARARLSQTRQFQAQQAQQKSRTAIVEKAALQSDTLGSIMTPLSRLSTELTMSRGASESPAKPPDDFLFHHCRLEMLSRPYSPNSHTF